MTNKALMELALIPYQNVLALEVINDDLIIFGGDEGRLELFDTNTLKIIYTKEIQGVGIILNIVKTSIEKEIAICTSNKGLIFGEVVFTKWFFSQGYTVNIKNENMYNNLIISSVTDVTDENMALIALE